MEVEGKLEWVAEIGAIVKQGEIIAQLNSRLYELQYESHNEYIGELLQQLKYVKREEKRKTKLHLRSVLSEQELDDINQHMALLKQKLKKAKVDKDLFKLNVQRSKVLAPFDGQVVTRQRGKGSYVEAGDEVLTLVDIYNKEISAKLPVAKALEITPNKTKVVIQWAGKVLDGHIKSIVQAGDKHSRLIEVRVISKQPLPPIAVPLNVTFTSETDVSVWKIPRDALIVTNNEQFVYQVTAQNKVNKVQVEIKSDKGKDKLLVIGNLNEEHDVIVKGAEQITVSKPVVKI